MKRGTPGHPKLMVLAAILGVPKYAAVGLLECLWHFAQSYAQRGDVGRHSDEAIAWHLGWSGDVPKLFAALVRAGWLDRCECHRLRIHDWETHADQGVKRSEVVKAQGFLECYSDASYELVRIQPAVAVAVPKPLPVPLPAPVPLPSAANGRSHERKRAPESAAPSQPTEPDPQMREYADAVWEEFTRHSGQHERVMGPTEWALVKRWFDAEYPLRYVLSGIREAGGKGGTLGYYRGPVEDAVSQRGKALLR